MSLFGWLKTASISDADVRAEVWKLGARHRGYPLEGAVAELKAPGLEPGRAALLRACIRKLQAT